MHLLSSSWHLSKEPTLLTLKGSDEANTDPTAQAQRWECDPEHCVVLATMLVRGKDASPAPFRCFPKLLLELWEKSHVSFGGFTVSMADNSVATSANTKGVFA